MVFRKLAICLLSVLCVSLITPTVLAQPKAYDKPPSKTALSEQAQRCRQILKTSLVDFYLPACVDTKNGGYFESLRDGKFVPTGERLALQARQLWFFSTLVHEGIDAERARAAAKAGFDFLQKYMRDPIQGGYYSKVTDTGAPKDTRKHVYLNAFALYGLVAYYRATERSHCARRGQGFVWRFGKQDSRSCPRRLYGVLHRRLAADHRSERKRICRTGWNEDLQHAPACPGSVDRALSRVARSARQRSPRRVAGHQHDHRAPSRLFLQHRWLPARLAHDPDIRQSAGELWPRR